MGTEMTPVRASRKGSLFLWASVACACIALNGRDEVLSQPLCEGPTASRPVVPATGANTAVPFDLGRVLQQVHFAFRADGHGWSGGHASYGVRATLQGITVTPQRGGTDVGLPVTFQLASIARAGAPIPVSVTTAGIDEAGQLVLRRGAVNERIQNTPDGVEQSWALGEMPAGTGDLVVKLRVLGANFSGESPGGLHFADARTRLGVRYGNATWLDAKGTRTTVPARFEAGFVVLRVPQATIDDSSYPALLDPVIGPEFGMDNPVIVAAPGSQQNPAVSFNGTNYLVCWEDSRTGGASLIYGTRVSPAGAVLDPSGIAIATQAATHQHPKIAANGGTSWLVVWDDQRNSATSGTDIYGARVSSAGAVLDANGIAIDTAPANQTTPAVAFNGANFYVVWQDLRNGDNDIFGVGVTAGGLVGSDGLVSVTAAGPPRVPPGGTSQQNPAIAFDGTNDLVVWQDNRAGGAAGFDIWGQFVDTAGNLVGGAAPNFQINQINTAAQTVPTIAYDSRNSDYLVAWQDTRLGANRIFGQRVSTGGVMLGGASDVQISSAAASTQSVPSATYLDDAACTSPTSPCFAVAYQDTRNATDVFGTMIQGNGTVLDPGGLQISAGANTPTTVQAAPALAYDGTNFLSVWTDSRSGVGDVYGARMSPARVLQDAAGILVSTSSNQQQNASLAYDGTNYLVVWQDLRAGVTRDIYGTRVTPTGVVLDAAGITINAAANDQTVPVVAYDGTNYLVVWQDARVASNIDIFGQRVSTGGSLVGSEISISGAQTGNQISPAVATDKTNSLVVWSDGRAGAGATDIYGARVTAAGAVLEPTGIPINTQAGVQASPAVAFDGTSQYLVVWQDVATGAIRGAEVDMTGNPTPAAGFTISSAAALSPGAPAVACDGASHLVVWQDSRAANFDIYGRQVVKGATSPVGSSDTPISTAANSQVAPAIAFDGTDLFAVWQDARSGTSQDIYGARINTSGVVVDGAGLEIATDVTDERRPRIASDASQHLIVAYDRFDGGPGLGSPRARARTISTVVLDVPGDDPFAFTLGLPNPNPSTRRVSFEFTLADQYRVRLEVFDMQGRRVWGIEQVAGPGVHTVPWDGGNDAGVLVGPGIYFARLEGAGQFMTRKLVRIR